ncbi:MAG: hydroxyacid dehydrogenase [Clostridia bacterium]|nr:hydroxyacid dehydrogenase [Clostridia bacterium]
MKLLITGAWNCTAEQLNILKSMGNEILFMQNEDDVLPQGFETVEGIIGNGLFLHHNIQQFQKLRYIQLTSAGFDRVPMDYIREHKIKLYNARGVYSIPMAEFAVCGVLQLLKKSKALMQSQQNREWKKQRELGELYRKTVCVMGCGSVGTEVAKRFSAFGCKVIGVDLFPREDAHYQSIYPLDRMEQVLGKSDMVVLTLPLTEQTKHLINAAVFEKMQKGTILVNIARGSIVDTEAMINALNARVIAGAVLDVFEEEPLCVTSPLWDMENVIITPHNSFAGEGNGERLWQIIKNNLESYV